MAKELVKRVMVYMPVETLVRAVKEYLEEHPEELEKIVDKELIEELKRFNHGQGTTLSPEG